MIDSRILVGLLAILIAVSGVVFIGIGEADRRVEFEEAFHGRSIEEGAALYTEYCAECHGLHGEGSPRAPVLNSKDFFENRVQDLGFQGGLEAYIKLTVAGGRQIKENPQYPENMPTWSTDFGGPLRNDEIDNVVAYIMNWQAEAPDLEAMAAAEPTPVPGDTPAERGANLYQGLGCVACHIINGEGGAVGPELTNVYEKGEDYIKESILMPNAVLSEGYQGNIMPQNFGDQLSDDDLNDIVAYFQSLVEGQ